MEFSNKNRTVKIGVISLLVLFVFLVGFIFYIVGSYQQFFKSTESFYMFVPDIQGLETGSFLTLAGLKVGLVGQLEFTQRDQKQGVLVELKIEKKYAHLITESSVASIKTMGVLGNKYVNVTPGGADQTPLKPGAFIENKPSAGVDEIASQATSAIQDFQVAIENINKMTEEAMRGPGVLSTLMHDKVFKDDLVLMLSNLKSITSRIANGKGSAGKFVQDTVLYDALSHTVRNLDDITDEIRSGEGSLGKMISDTTLYGRFDSISLQADLLLKDLREKGTAAELIESKQLYDQLLELTTSLNQLTEDIKKNPRKYISLKVF